MKRALLPSQRKTLTALGENIKLARLRRELSSEQVAERAGISRNTLTKIERGEEGVAMGYYFRVLAILGLEKDLLLVAKDDELGRALQDAKLVAICLQPYPKVYLFALAERIPNCHILFPFLFWYNVAT